MNFFGVGLGYSQKKEILRESLIGLLCGAILTTQGFSAPAWSDESVDTQDAQAIEINTINISDFPKAIQEPYYNIQKSLKSALVRSQYFGAPGVGTAPSVQELDDISRRLQGLREQLETEILHYVEEGSGEGQKRKLAFRSGVIAYSYFSLVLDLERVRAFIGLPTDPTSWESKYSLKISTSGLLNPDMISSLAQQNQQFLSDDSRMTTKIQNHHLILNLPFRLVREIEEQKLALKEKKKAGISILQYLAVDTLLANQFSVRRKLGHPKPLEIPDSLKDQYPPLKFKNEILTQDLRRAVEASLRTKAEHQVADILTDLHHRGLYFSTPAFVQELSQTLDNQNLTEEDNRETLIALRDEESRIGGVSFQSMVHLVEWPESFDVEGIVHSLEVALVESMSVAIRGFLFDQMTLTPEQWDKVQKAISRGQSQYGFQVKEFLGSYGEGLASLANRTVLKEKELFEESIMKSVKDIRFLSGNMEVPADFSTLAAIRRADLLQLPFSKSGAERLLKLTQSSNYQEAWNSYQETLLSQLSLYQQGESVSAPDLSLYDPAQIRNWLKTAGVLQEAQGISSIVQSDTQSWIRSGELLGLFQLRQKRKNGAAELLVRDLNLSKFEQKSYASFLQNKLLEESPFLLTKRKDHKTVMQTLFGSFYSPREEDSYESSSDIKNKQSLKSDNLENTLFAALLENPLQSPGLIQEALQTLDINLSESLERLAGQQNSLWTRAARLFYNLSPSLDVPDELAVLLSHSAYLSHQLATHPALTRVYADQVSEFMNPTFGSRVFSHVSDSARYIAFTAIAWIFANFLTKLFIKVPVKVPFVSAGMSGLGRVFSNFESGVLAPAFPNNMNVLNQAILGVFLSELAWNGLKSYYTLPAIQNVLENYQSCSVSGPCFVTRDEADLWKNFTESEQRHFKMDVVFLVAVLVGAGVIGYVGSKINAYRIANVAKDLENDLKNIGIGQGGRDYSSDPRIIGAVAEANRAAVASPLGKRIHPVFGETAPITSDSRIPREMRQTLTSVKDKFTKDTDVRDVGMLRSPTHGEIAQLWYQERLALTAEKAIQLVQKQEIYWRKWADRFRYQFKRLGLATFPDVKVILSKFDEIETLFKEGKISLDERIYLQHSLRQIYQFIAPHLKEAARNEAYASLLRHVWHVGPRTVSLDAQSLRQFGIHFADDTGLGGSRVVPLRTTHELSGAVQKLLWSEYGMNEEWSRILDQVPRKPKRDLVKSPGAVYE